MDDSQDPQIDTPSPNDADTSVDIDAASPKSDGGDGSDAKSPQIFDISDDNISPASNLDEDRSLPVQKIAPKPVVKPQPIPLQNIPVIPQPPKPIPIPPKPLEQPAALAFKGGPISSLQRDVGSIMPKNLQPKEEVPKIKAMGTPGMGAEKIVTNPKYEQKNVRTYESDVADVLAHTKTSSTSIALAESRRNQGSAVIGSEAPTHSARKLIMVLISLVLIGGGAFGAYYFYSKSPFAQNVHVVQEPKIISIIPSDTHVVLPITTLGQGETISRIRQEYSKPQASGTIKEIIIVNDNASTSQIPAINMVDRLGIGAPNILSRTLTPQWMLGVYADDNGRKSAFAVVTTNYFQNAFSGMLQWEKIMPDDIKQYLYLNPPQGIANVDKPSDVSRDPLANLGNILPTSFGTSTDSATSTPQIASSTKKSTLSTSTPGSKNKIVSSTVATSTASSTHISEPEPVIQAYTTIQGQFEDRIVKNKDVRAFKTSDGNILFLYSFIDNTKLLITDKESTLAEILGRLEKQAFMR